MMGAKETLVLYHTVPMRAAILIYGSLSQCTSALGVEAP